MSAAFRPSTLSAFRPVASPVAFVTNGLAFALGVAKSLPDWMTPSVVPDAPWNWNALPLPELSARRQGVDTSVLAMSAPSADRQLRPSEPPDFPFEMLAPKTPAFVFVTRRVVRLAAPRAGLRLPTFMALPELAPIATGVTSTASTTALTSSQSHSRGQWRPR